MVSLETVLECGFQASSNSMFFPSAYDESVHVIAFYITFMSQLGIATLYFRIND